jgi:hypothetical protein
VWLFQEQTFRRKKPPPLSGWKESAT